MHNFFIIAVKSILFTTVLVYEIYLHRTKRLYVTFFFGKSIQLLQTIPLRCKKSNRNNNANLHHETCSNHKLLQGDKPTTNFLGSYGDEDDRSVWDVNK